MPRHALRTVSVAGLGGIANAAVVVALLTYFDYPLIETNAELATLAAQAFLLGFVPLLITAHTRLLAPAGGFAILLGRVVHAELTSPAPEKVGELGSNAIVEGPFHVRNYAEAWFALLALLLIAGVVEFALRRGYGLGADRLRNLPALPLSRPVLVGVLAGLSGFVGASAVLLVRQSTGLATGEAAGVFLGAAAATAVPLAALLTRGYLAPLFPFALAVPHGLLVEAFGTPDSYVHISILGRVAVFLALVWLLEYLFRSRYRGWNGGGFVGRTDAG